MSKNRIFKLSVALVLAVVAALAITAAAFSSRTPSASVLSDSSHYQFRLSEHQAGQNIVDVRYEFRLGEIAQMSNPIDSLAEFRFGERAQYAQVATSSIGSAAWYQYRQGEWFGN